MSESLESKLQELKLSSPDREDPTKEQKNVAEEEKQYDTLGDDVSTEMGKNLLDEKWVETTIMQNTEKNPMIRWTLPLAAGKAWNSQYDKVSQDPLDLNRAIAYFERARDVDDQSKNVEAMIEIDSFLGKLLEKRFAKSNNSSDIDDAIDAYDNVIKLTDELPEADLVEMSKNIANLARAKFCKFDKLGNKDSLTSAIEGWQTALALLEDDDSPDTHKIVIGCLAKLCLAARLKFEDEGDENALQVAIESGQKAVDMLDENDPTRGDVILDLSLAIFKQDKLLDVDNAIHIGRQALRFSVQYRSNEEALVVRLVLSLGGALWQRHLSDPSKRVDDLDEVVLIYERAMEHLESDNSELPKLQQKLDEARHAKDALQVKEYSNAGVVLEQVDPFTYSPRPSKGKGKSVTQGPPKRSRDYFNEGVALQTKFLKGMLFKDIDDAVKCFREAIEFDDTIYPEEVMFSFSISLALRFLGPNRLEDLDYAIETMQRSVKMVRKDSPLYYLSLNSLCSLAHLRYCIKFKAEDLDLAIKIGEEAIEASQVLPKPVDAKDPRATGLAVLCCAYVSRVRRAIKKSLKTYEKFSIRVFPLSAIKDINRAVELGKEALTLMSHNEEAMGFGEQILQDTMEVLELATGLRQGADIDIDDDEELEVSTTAAEEYDEAHDGLEGLIRQVGVPEWLIPTIADTTTGGVLKQEARAIKDRTRQITETEISLWIAESGIYDFLTEKPLPIIPLQLPSRKALPDNLKSTGDHLSFEDNMFVFQPMHRGVLTVFAHAMWNRRQFETSRSIKDLNSAGNAFKRCAELLGYQPNCPNMALILRNWGEVLHTRFKAKGLDDASDSGDINFTDINDSVQKLDQALEFLSSDSEAHVRAGFLKTLGDALSTRFGTNRTPLVDMSGYASNAWDVETRPFKVEVFEQQLQRKVDDDLAQRDIDRVIVCLQDAVELVKWIPRLYALYSWHLAKALGRRAGLTNSDDDREEAISNLEIVSKNPMVSISCRISAVNAGVRLLIKTDNLQRANAFAAFGVELLPLLQFAEDAVERRKKSHLYRGMTAQAVSLSIACGDEPYRSLRLSEIGRGILESDEINNRYFSDLEGIDAELAKRFKDLNAELQKNISEPSDLEGFGGGILTTDYDGVMSQYEDCVEQIRQLPGFETFLDAPPESSLLKMVKGGSIALLNVSDMRSDAILVTPQGTSTCNLKDIKVEKLRKTAQDFVREVNIAPGKRTDPNVKSVNPILEWLWDVVVGPVLRQLGYTNTPAEGESWPRVWWIATGVLSFLPLHAAGYHEEKSGRTTMDRVVSSYLSTVNSFAYAFSRALEVKNDQDLRATLLGISSIPSRDELASAEEEIGTVISMMQEIEPVMLEDGTRSELLAAVKENQLAHLICHGDLSLDDPSQCRLLLSDWKTSPLSAEDIAKIRNNNAQFAYLSVCPKSDSNALRFTDESLHYSSPFLIAGFPSVIECLSSISNENFVEVARLVYEHLMGDEKKFDPGDAAAALHNAIRSLRKSNVEENGRSDPLVWARFTHWGI